MILGLVLVGTGFAFGQGALPEVTARVEAVSLDSLILYVSELSGEIPIQIEDRSLLIYSDTAGLLDSVWVSDTLLAIPNRYHVANEPAAELLRKRLRSFGYDSVVAAVYPGLPFTRNVVAYKPGSDSALGAWVLCAHYDSVVEAPGADDNGSGTAAVLEVARVLARTDLNASIIFGLWDSEEVGLFGADQFASQAYEKDLPINGVLNMDMIGWDGDGDRILQIHADRPAVWIAEYISEVARRYDVGVNLNLRIPGTGRSDHVPFRNWGFPAVKIIEEEDEDFNPYYHSKDDVINHFDIGYYHEVVKLAVATITELALSGTAVAVEHGEPLAAPDQPLIKSIHPNPARAVLHVQYRMAGVGEVRLTLTDVLGRQILERRDGARPSGSSTVSIQLPSNLPSGLYFATLRAEGQVETKPFVVVR